MKLRCFSCGAIGSADAFTNDANARELLAVATKLPHPLPPIMLHYLTMFRPEKTMLSWGKALRLTKDLAALVAAGTIQVEKKVARPCPPRLWALGIEQVTERRDRLRLPLKNHNYLKQIVYDLADREDARNEAAYHQAAAAGNHRTYQLPEPEPDDGLLPIERKMLAQGIQPPHLKKME